jgi:hypothetical protein
MTIVETKPAPAESIADAERRRIYQRDVAQANRLADEVAKLWAPPRGCEQVHTRRERLQ